MSVQNYLYIIKLLQRIIDDGHQEWQKTIDHWGNSLAHQLYNPLMSVLGLGELLEKKILTELKAYLPKEEYEYLVARVSRILNDARRVYQHIKVIRDFSQVEINTWEEIHFGHFLDEVLEEFKEAFAQQKISVYKKVFFSGVVYVNPSHLKEIFFNCLDNSVKALYKAQNPFIEIKVKNHRLNKIIISIKDNGIGISKELLGDIFLDFVTTKGSVEGLGMGLSRVRKIVNCYGGKVWAQSAGEGKGAIFSIELPIVT